MKKLPAFSLIEILITIAILGTISAISIPAYDNYMIKTKLKQMYEAAAGSKLLVSQAILDGQEIGCVNLNNWTSSKSFISSIDVNAGVITVSGNSAELNGNAIQLFIYPNIDLYGNINWSCEAASSWHSLVPEQCRNAPTNPSFSCTPGAAPPAPTPAPTATYCLSESESYTLSSYPGETDSYIWPGTPINNTASFACPAGYNGNITRACSATAVWQSTTDDCVLAAPAPDCATVKNVSYTLSGYPSQTNTYTWNTTSPGDTYVRSCPSGYTGSVSRQCSMSGSWQTPTDDCVQNTSCPASTSFGYSLYSYPTQSNSYSWPQTNLSTMSNLSCPIGYTGNVSRYCSSSGSWGSVSDNCTAAPTCSSGTSSYTLSSYPSQTDSYNWSETNSSDTASLSCPTGYTGSVSRACDSGGNWQTPTDNCTLASTFCSSNTSNYTLSSYPSQTDSYSWPQTNTSTTASLSCPSGYTGNVSRQCDASDVWQTPTDDCTTSPPPPPATPDYCSTIIVGTNSTSSFSSFIIFPQDDVGATASLSCGNYYSGSVSATCNTDAGFPSGGSWDHDAPTSCTVNTSPTPTHPSAPYGRCPEETIEYIGVLTPSPSGYQYTGTTYELVWPETLAGNTANLSCPNGLVGNRTRTCSAAGNPQGAVWGGQSSIDCSEP